MTPKPRFASIVTGLTLIGAATAAQAVERLEVVQHNAAIAYAAYSDALETAKALQQAIERLLARPGEGTLEAARQAWRAAREPYLQTEVYRFQHGPIDDLNDEGRMVEGEGPEGRINAWPLDEAIIDYVARNVDGNSRNEDQPRLSLVQDVKFKISSQSLAQMNEYKGNEANVTTGYHAIEFLLWGQDLNQGEKSWDGKARRDSSPGQRPYTDYVVGKGCTSGSGKPDKPEICKRRGEYLKAAAQLLVDDLSRVSEAWAPDRPDNYRAEFTRPENVEQSLLKILVGMGSLGYGELAGERILVALAANSQEDEHSCFSDNTHRDIWGDALGIQNVYLGRYVRIDGSELKGPGIKDLLDGDQAALGEQLAKELEATLAAAKVIDDKAKEGLPFDRLIEQYPGKDGDGRPVLNANLANNILVNNVVVALQQQTGTLEQVVHALLGEVKFEIESSPAFQ